jgi:hypothetical protein
VHDAIKPNEYIEYTMGDERKVKINFTGDASTTKVVESVESEDTNPIEMQKAAGRQFLTILKKYTEASQ